MKIQTVKNLDTLRQEDPVSAATALTDLGMDHKKVIDHLNLTFQNPENKVNNRVLNITGVNENSSCDTGGEAELEVVQREFNIKAISVRGPQNLDRKRENDIVVILGSSGTGKTFFATKGLPLDKHASSVTIYVKLSNVGRHFVKNLDELEQQLRHTLECGAPSLTSEWPPKRKVTRKLDMQLSLVVDEASAAGDFLGKYKNLVKIYGVIAKFATSPRLVIAGTNLESITKDLGSDDEVRKYKMIAWEKHHMEAIAHNQEIMSVIDRHGLYRDMMTNARAARFLVNEIQERLRWDGGGRIVAEVVQSVARQYIQNNGLDSLSPLERRMIAAIVLKMLHEASDRKEEAYLPESSGFWPVSGGVHGSEEIKRLAVSLLEINSQTSKGDINLPEGENYSFSISRALSIVLLALLDVTSFTGEGWSGFETKTALMEIQSLVVKKDLMSAAATRLDSWPKVSILRNPFPAPAAKNRYSIPAVARNGVYLNGPGAPFADVIGYHRLCQCKHRSSSDGEANIKRDEFIKLGVVAVESLPEGEKTIAERNGALLSALCHEWKTNSVIHEQVDCSDDTSDPSPRGTKRMAYPLSAQLVSSRENEERTGLFRDALFDAAAGEMSWEGHGQRYAFTALDPLPQTVEVVIYTNADTVRFGRNCVVSENDVDVDGCIVTEGKQEEIVEALCIQLREHVEIRCILLPGTA